VSLQQWLQRAAEWVLSSGLTVLFIVILTIIALRLAKLLSARLFAALKRGTEEIEVHKRADTLGSIVKYILSVAIIGAGVMMVLGELGVNIGPILAGAGIIGLAVGFGAQNIVRDMISGFFILLDDQIRVGDVVEVAGKSGLVEKINLRLTTLRDLAGNVHYVRNGQVEIITNMTKEYSRCVFDIGVAYRENVDEVINVIRQVGEELRSDPQFSEDVLEPIEILGLDQFGESAIVIKARIKTKPIKQWSVGREFNRRLKMRFDEENIEIPFPHVTLYMGEGKQGGAPPLHVSVLEKQAAESK